MTFIACKKFSCNANGGKDYIVGDIHGCFTKLQTLLHIIGFDETKDRLFSVGDLVDRGPESRLALEWLAKPWFHAVRGNHEQMAIDYMTYPYADMYVMNGGAWYVGMTKQEQIQYADAFSELPIAIELETATGKIGIVHAECSFDHWDKFVDALNNPQTKESATESAMWNRDKHKNKNTSIVNGVDFVVVGHTPMKESITLGNTIYIDTGAVFAKPNNGYGFTVFDVDTLKTVEMKQL